MMIDQPLRLSRAQGAAGGVAEARVSATEEALGWAGGIVSATLTK